MPTLRITQETAETWPVDPAKDVLLWDESLPGFGVVIKKTGARSFFAFYRTRDNRQRRQTVGRLGVFTVKQARDQARAILVAASKGEDPLADREARRGSTTPTVKDLGERYLAEWAIPRKKPSSLRDDTRHIHDVIVPALGDMRVEEVTRRDVLKFQQSRRDHPTNSNRLLALLSKMFNLAEQWGLRPDGSNPCRHVARFAERKRQRYMTPEEVRAFAELLAVAESNWRVVNGGATGGEGGEIFVVDAETGERRPATQAERESGDFLMAFPTSCAVLRYLLFTGCRLGEALTLRWESVDLESATITLRDSKTGARRVVLNKAARALLEGLPRVSEWVFPGRRDGQPLNTPHKAFRAVCKAARIENLRVHDLRHAFASVGASMQMSLPIIGALLGHKKTETTARYAHLLDDPIRAANEAIGEALEGMMSGKVQSIPKPKPAASDAEAKEQAQ